MDVQSISLRLAAVAAVAFIAVLVWRIGTRFIFDDHDGRRANGVEEVASSDAGKDSSIANPIPWVPQAADGSLVLTPDNVNVLSPSLRQERIAGAATLSGWRGDADYAEWGAQLTQIGDGYWRARVRYRSLQAVRLQLLVNNKRLAIWTLPEARESGLEEKLIRIPQIGAYPLRASPVGDATSLQLLEIAIAPRRD